MRGPDEVRRDLVLHWLSKADQDLDAAVHLSSDESRFSEAIAFHCQHAVEKYLKAVLVRHQIDFPKTHDIGKLLDYVASVDYAAATLLRGADVMTPFGVEVRYPSDAPELLPGEVAAAIDIAHRTRGVVASMLAAYLAAGNVTEQR